MHAQHFNDVRHLCMQGFMMGQMGQLHRAPTNATKLGGPVHYIYQDNEIDLFRIVDFSNLKFSIQKIHIQKLVQIKWALLPVYGRWAPLIALPQGSH